MSTPSRASPSGVLKVAGSAVSLNSGKTPIAGLPTALTPHARRPTAEAAVGSGPKRAASSRSSVTEGPATFASRASATHFRQSVSGFPAPAHELAVKTAQDTKKVDPVFETLSNLKDERERLQELTLQTAETVFMSKDALEELRKMLRPPRAVRECLEVVYLTLHVEALRQELSRSVPNQSVCIDWKDIQKMLVRYDSLIPMMQNYDISSLLASPELLAYLRRTYFGPGTLLTYERVLRCSSACAGLFKWCSTHVERAQAAAELATIERKIEEVEATRQDGNLLVINYRLDKLEASPLISRCKLESDAKIESQTYEAQANQASLMTESKPLRGEVAKILPSFNHWAYATPCGQWREYPEDISLRLSKAFKSRHREAVEYEFSGDDNTADMIALIWKNKLRQQGYPIRAPSANISLDALQGIWQALPGKLDFIYSQSTSQTESASALSEPVRSVWVKDKRVVLDGREVDARLENKGNGVIMWAIAGTQKLSATGNSMRVVWKQGGEDVLTWEPAAIGFQRMRFCFQ